jgi:hypothetical protein
MPIVEEIQKRPDFLPLAENNSVGEAGEALRKEVEADLNNTVKGSVYWAATVLLSKAQTKLFDLATLRSNWDSYGAPAPNKTALENAVRILEHMKPFDLALANIVPSAEGGVGFCFISGDRYADIESSNEGEMIGVRYTGMQTPVLIEMDGTDVSIETALEQIRNHVRA